MNAGAPNHKPQMRESAPTLAWGRSYVYFLRPVGEAGPVKIGCSNAPYTRLTAYAAWSPLALEIVALIEGGQNLERRFHGQFEHLRLHHEWFRADPALDAVIAAVNAGTFDINTLGEPSRLRQSHGWTAESRSAAGYMHKLRRLRDRGVAIPPEVDEARFQYRCSPDVVAAKRAIIREFVDRALTERASA